MFIRNHPQRSSRSGFSLLELLLVMALLPIVFYTVFSNFSVGMRVWQAVNVQTPVEDLAIFYQKARADLENTFSIQTIPFEGEKDSVSFPSTVQTIPALGGDRGIGRVRLFYDSNAKGIAREVWDYSEVYRESEGKKSLLLQNVSSLEFSYLVQDATSQEYEWVSSWTPEPDKLPIAVRMLFSVGRGSPIERTYFLPAGG